MLCGYPPFFANSEQAVLKKVLKGVYSFDSKQKINLFASRWRLEESFYISEGFN
jgi:hypothetical protein